MTVYLLNVSIYPRAQERCRQEAVNVARQNYSDAFSSMGMAASAGTKMMAKWLERLREAMFKDENIDDIANDEIMYDFFVYEFDPAVKRDLQGNREQYAKWEYNYKGDIVYRQEILPCPDAGAEEKRLAGWTWRQGDEKESAGTLFKLGEFVNLNSNQRYHNGLEDIVFVIGETPCKKTDDKAWENTYALYFIGKNAKFYITVAHETEISAHGGEISEENPLCFLKKIATGEVKISPKTWEDINNHRIIFDWQGGMHSWRSLSVYSEKMDDL